MKKMIVLFLVLGVFLVGVVAAVAYSIGFNSGYNSGYNHVIYSQEIHTNNDGYSIVIDGEEHLYNQLGGLHNGNN